MNTTVNSITLNAATTKPIQRAWWSYLLWVPAAAILGFLVPAIFAGILHLPRNMFLVPYFALIGVLLYSYLRWSKIDISASIRYHWGWGILGGIITGFFAARTVLIQSPSPAPQGLALIFNLGWLGILYGAVDALFLSVLPLSATWEACSALGWTKRWPGRIAASILSLIASLLVILFYHLGYPECRGPQVMLIVAGVGIQSLITLLTGSPITAVLAHIIMHITAVLYGFSSVSQLPPHY